MFRLLDSLLRQFVGEPKTRPPPSKPREVFDFYGFFWQAGRGASPDLQGWAPFSPQGIYIGFTANHLDRPSVFGDGDGVGPVFQVPDHPSEGLTALVNTYRGSDVPLGQRSSFLAVTPERLREIQGFLNYVPVCLDDIVKTATGSALVQKIKDYSGATRTPHPVFIIPSYHNDQPGNQTFGGDSTLFQVARMMTGKLAAIETADLLSLVNNRCQALANAVNNMPLYSLFVDESQWEQTFLGQHLTFKGHPIGGEVLSDWIKDGDVSFAVFMDSNQQQLNGVSSPSISGTR